MPSKLSERRDKKIRDLLYRSWDETNVASYDPSLPPSNSDFIPITTNWYKHGQHNPSITVTNFDGNIVGGGGTGYSSVQGDGSGLNQTRSERGLLTIRAEDKIDYNGHDAQEILKLLGDECNRVISNNAPARADSEAFYFTVEPFEDMVEELDSGSVEFVKQASVGFGWQKTP